MDTLFFSKSRKQRIRQDGELNWRIARWGRPPLAPNHRSWAEHLGQAKRAKQVGWHVLPRENQLEQGVAWSWVVARTRPVLTQVLERGGVTM